jgi:hypothetical protein
VLEVLDRHADCPGLADELYAVQNEALAARREAGSLPWGEAVGIAETLWAPTQFSAFGAAWTMCGMAPYAVSRMVQTIQGMDCLQQTWDQLQATEATLARDIFGPLPFRQLCVDPAVLAWQGFTVARIAEAIYEGRQFEDLPILADALEDAGCTDAEILEHLRGPGLHVRGCWVVDLILCRP